MRVCLTAFVIAMLLGFDGGSLAQRADGTASVVSDRDAFFTSVRANLIRAERVTHQFSYKERRTRFHTNPFGRLGTGAEELFHVFPSIQPGLTYRRLLARHGSPLSADELTRQDREYRSRSASVRRRLETETPADRHRRLDDESRTSRRGQAMVEDVIAALDFTISGRGDFDGQPGITVTFAGKPDARPKTREGRIAHKFAGTIWIHSERHEVMHVAAQSTETVSFGYGMIARLNEGTMGSLTRQPVEPDLWMPTAVRLTGDGRAVLRLRRLEVDFKVDWFDYRRFDGTVPVAP